jgi:hypothetical protein
VIADKIGDFLYTGSGGAQKHPGGEFVRFDLSGPEIEWADALYRRKEDENVWACVYRLEGTEVTPHDVLRKVIRGKCSVAKCSSGVYVKSEVPEGPEWRTWYAWRSQGSLLVLVCSVACDPQQVAFKYLERYPSDLPKELKIEKLEWGRAEMDYCLGLMNQMFEAANPDSYPLSSARCFEFLARNVLIPPDVARIQYDDPVPKRREAFERLKKWWDENKEKSYWHKGYQKLAVKGYTPEELAEVEQKRREAEIKAKLDAELTEDDLKRITPAVVNKLEAWMRHLTDVTNNTIGADSGCKFERIGDAEWHRYYRQCKECVLHRVTITGPTLRKWRDRRCPLIAEFRCVDRNMDTGKDTEWKTVYTYWRLEDRWSEGPPPK